jgi:hypothetical protein
MVSIFGLGLPLALGIPDTLTGNVYALAALLLIAAGSAALIVAFLRRPNRPFSLPSTPPAAATAPVRIVEYRLDTSAWSLALLKRIEWRRFEELCAAYFEMLGFTSRATRLAVDGGVDIDLYQGGSESRSIIVQCKAWSTTTVGIAPVRALRDAMTSEKVPEGVLVTSGQFTREARDYATRQNINLINGADLLGKIDALDPEKGAALLKLATQGDFLTPTCPSCAVKMESRTSTEGGRKFWGCRNYPRCKQTFFSTHNAPA